MDTRRKFIVQAAALAASTMVGARESRALGASPQRQLGFALCGLGNLSTHQIAPALQKTANCRLAARYLTGEEPVWISAATTQGDPARFSEVEESVVWEAKFPGGAVSHCGSSYNTPGVGYFRAIAERGWFGLEPAFNYDGTRGMRSDGRAIEFPPTDQFAAEMDDFARCLVEGKATRVPGEEGLRDVSLMMSIYASARTGRPIDLRGG